MQKTIVRKQCLGYILTWETFVKSIPGLLTEGRNLLTVIPASCLNTWLHGEITCMFTIEKAHI